MAALPSEAGPSPYPQHEALFEACKAGQTEVALSLVRTQGADVHAADEYGRTALYHAAEGGHVATIRALVLALCTWLAGGVVRSCVHVCGLGQKLLINC